MDKHEETRTWLRFFKEAGIPKQTGASYAHMFVENRIHKDMLSELTVDYLRLMGIALMGDIIAILRHCKSVHQDSVRKVVILQSKKDEPKKLSLQSSISSADSSDDDEDDVEVIEVTKTSTKSIPISAKTTDTNVKNESTHSTESIQVKSQVVGKIISSNPTTVSDSEKRTVQPVKRKHDCESDKEEQVSRSTSNGGKSILKSSAKKVQVMTGNDSIGPKLPPTKKTVFERLGAEAELPQVSSTTEVPLVDTKFTRVVSSGNMLLKSANIMTEDDDSIHKISSVFKRLGQQENTQPAKGTSSILPYAGVLKTPPSVKTSLRITKSNKIVRGTMRADEPEVPVKLRATVSDRKTLLSRVDGMSSRSRLKPSQLTKTTLFSQKPRNTGSQGIFANDSQAANISVKQRLGFMSNPGEVSSTNSFRQRIGSRLHPPVVKKQSSKYDDAIGGFRFKSDVERLSAKKVSFGKVERKSVTPVGYLRSSVYGGSNSETRSGIHSRLGKVRNS